MPRIRTVKPEFWNHPVLGRCSDAAKLLALALLNYADDEGYFLADEPLVRNFARPRDDDTRIVHGAIRELITAEYIEVVVSPTHGEIGRVVTFSEHQVINRPNKSTLKQHFASGSRIVHGSLTDRSMEEGKGREGKEDPSAVASGGVTEPAPPEKPKRKKRPAEDPTPEQKACRAAISERFEAEYRKRTGAEFDWTGGDRKAVVTLANLDKAGGVDPTKGLRALAVFVERAQFLNKYANDFRPRKIADEINNLRAPLQAGPQQEAPKSRAEVAPPTSDVLARIDEERRLVEEQKARGFKPPLSPFGRKEKQEVAGG